MLETWQVEIENMKTVGIDTFTQFQINKLLAVANQCPLSGGDGVFKARSLYSLVDPLVKYDDEMLCEPAPEARPQHTLQPELPKGFHLIPNPARDELRVKLAVPVEARSWFFIQDIHGRIYFEKELDAGSARYYINTNQLPSGIYYCTIRSQGSTHKTEKLIIIH
ncbi:MAG: T9SS type A sorting domain-containing protein [Lewinellaceae bacterium]|nr:T9SS type A sorting domain-containing protein [Lewinellaceae bacterium]